MLMLDVPLLITIIFGLTLSLLGLVTLIRNVRDPINRHFSAFSIAVSIWLVVNYVAASPDMGHAVALVSNRLVLIAGGLAIVTLMGFVMYLSRLQRLQKIYRPLLAVNMLSWAICLSPLVVADVSVQNNQVVNEFGVLAAGYFLPLFLTFIVVVAVLIVGHRRLDGVQRRQLDSVSKSILTAIPVIILCNAILPIAGYYDLVGVAPAALSIIVFTMFYTIVKHRLFDLRLAIARSLGYVLSLGILAVFFGFLVFGVASIFFNQGYSVAFEVYASLATAVIALSFSSIKRFFDRLTRKLFLQDSYSSQELLSELNKNILTNVEVEPLLVSSAGIVQNYLKLSFCTVELNATSYADRRSLGNGPTFAVESIKNIRQLMMAYGDRVLVTDEIQDVNPALHELLSRSDIAAVARLGTLSMGSEESIGVIFFGIKKSGNPINVDDKENLRIIAGDITVATQNALRFEEIENFNITLRHEIENATKRLKRANEKLKAMDETKDEFISMASHQLRTPLTSVKGYVSMVLEGDAGPLNDMQKKLLEQSFISSQRMVYLIADLLNLSRLKTGKFVIEPKPTNLAEVVQGELMQLSDTAKSKDIKFVFKQPKQFPSLMLDETKIRQVIMNFVDNAIYYTPPGGKVEIALRETDDMVEFTVHDNGIGVPAAEQPHLFTKFYRAKNAQKARPDGTGLGLFMAKKVIVAQGGATLFSSQEGKGSTFGFTFSKDKLKVP